MLKTGDKAPDFNLPDADMEEIKLADFLGKKQVILYFYPKDDTPGCTLEGIEFSDLEAEFAAQEAVVLGVSKDDCMSHAAFRDKHGLSVRLLADVDGEACAAYGVWQEKEKDGVKRMGIVRSTFIIGKDGVLTYAQYGVTAKGHANEILQFIKQG